MTPAHQPSPEAVYSIYTKLRRAGRAPDAPAIQAGAIDAGLGGTLVLYALLDAAGAATAMAASIAGAASLGLDPDPERLKQAIRNGACDFVVNGLDEALRILKNEIRKKQPVSVGLVTAVPACLAAIVDRGVQPDLLVFGSERDLDLAELVRRGARPLSGNDPSPPPLQQSEAEEVWWSVAEAPARWLPRLDALATAVLAANGVAANDLRSRWLRLSPRYFARASHHYLKMTSPEALQFMESVEQQTASGTIATAVTVERRTLHGHKQVQTFPTLL